VKKQYGRAVRYTELIKFVTTGSPYMELSQDSDATVSRYLPKGTYQIYLLGVLCKRNPASTNIFWVENVIQRVIFSFSKQAASVKGGSAFEY
jgi:hypothetical protein